MQYRRQQDCAEWGQGEGEAPVTLGSLSHSKGSVSHVQNSLYRGDEDLKSKRAGSYQLHKAHTDHFPNLPSLTSFAFGSIFFSLLNSCPTSPAHPSPFPWSGGEGQIAVSAAGWVAASWHSCAVLPCPPRRLHVPRDSTELSPASFPLITACSSWAVPVHTGDSSKGCCF